MIIELNKLNLNSFLKFGYFLNYKNPNIQLNFKGIDKKKYINYSEESLINEGTKRFKKAIKRNFNSKQKQLVSLSGGLDSRAILAELLNFTEAQNIATYTFGTPGTWDYDIGNFIAKKIGTNHTSFPLTDHEYTLDELIDISKRTDHQARLFLHPPLRKIDEIFKDYVIWLGFMGDPIAGSHRVNKPNRNIIDAKKYFLEKENTVNSIDLSNCKNEDLFQFLNISFVSNNKISFEEQLDFKIRQLKYIAPHIMFRGYEYKLPFIDEDYLNFMLSIPEKYRKNNILYKKMLLKAYPDIFNFPTKSNAGLPLNSGKAKIMLKKIFNKVNKMSRIVGISYKNSGINYIDFNNSIKNRNDIRTIIYNCVMDLKQRNILNWLDIMKIWEDHNSNVCNYSDALFVLASLEVHLKAGKNI